VQKLRHSILLVFTVLQIGVFLAATVKPAHAYVDPGSGLLFFQVGGSMLAGALIVLRTKIRKALGLKPKTETNPLETSTETAGESPVRTGTRG
jgi:hypothetical protein